MGGGRDRTGREQLHVLVCQRCARAQTRRNVILSACLASDAGLRGSMVGADTLANTRIGGPYGTVLVFRFRSRWIGVVRSSALLRGGEQRESRRLQRRHRRPPAGEPCSRRRPPRATCRPATALASAAVAASSRDSWPLVRFAKAPKVVAGRYYHVVFTNDDPDPRDNYVSINALLSYGHDEAFASHPRRPRGAAREHARRRSNTPSQWETRTEQHGSALRANPRRLREPGPPSTSGWATWRSGRVTPSRSAATRRCASSSGARRRRAIAGAWLRVRRQAGANTPCG